MNLNLIDSELKPTESPTILEYIHLDTRRNFKMQAHSQGNLLSDIKVGDLIITGSLNDYPIFATYLGERENMLSDATLLGRSIIHAYPGKEVKIMLIEVVDVSDNLAIIRLFPDMDNELYKLTNVNNIFDIRPLKGE